MVILIFSWYHYLDNLLSLLIHHFYSNIHIPITLSPYQHLNVIIWISLSTQHYLNITITTKLLQYNYLNNIISLTLRQYLNNIISISMSRYHYLNIIISILFFWVRSRISMKRFVGRLVGHLSDTPELRKVTVLR